MNNKLIWIVIAAVVLVGGYFVLGNGGADAPVNEAPTNTQTTTKPKPTGSVVPTTNITTTGEKIPSTGKVQVDIKGFSFVSKTVRVAPGTTIVWKNFDSAPHSVIGPDFASPILNQGQSFTHTFTKEGDFSYYCGLHPDMTGSVVVRNF